MLREDSTLVLALRRVDRSIHVVSQAFLVPGIIVLVGISIMITLGVMVRELAFIPWQWTFVEEYSAYFLVLIIFFALAYALRVEAHITVDVLVRHLPQRPRTILEFVLTLGALAIVVVMLKFSLDRVIFAYQRHIVSNFPSLTPMWIPYLFVFIGLIPFGFALVMHAVGKLLEVLAGRPLLRLEEEKIEIHVE